MGSLNPDGSRIVQIFTICNNIGRNISVNTEGLQSIKHLDSSPNGTTANLETSQFTSYLISNIVKTTSSSTDTTFSLKGVTAMPNGDITSVTAGSNLTGGGTSGDVTIGLSNTPSIYSLTVENPLTPGFATTIDGYDVTSLNLNLGFSGEPGKIRFNSDSANPILFESLGFENDHFALVADVGLGGTRLYLKRDDINAYAQVWQGNGVVNFGVQDDTSEARFGLSIGYNLDFYDEGGETHGLLTFGGDQFAMDKKLNAVLGDADSKFDPTALFLKLTDENGENLRPVNAGLEGIYFGVGNTFISSPDGSYFVIQPGKIILGDTAGVVVQKGSGDPNGSITGSPGDIFLRTNGGVGSTFYVKETGNNTNTGWAAK